MLVVGLVALHSSLLKLQQQPLRGLEVFTMTRVLRLVYTKLLTSWELCTFRFDTDQLFNYIDIIVSIGSFKNCPIPENTSRRFFKVLF